MNRLLKRYAKLRSEIEASDTDIIIAVYDDELDADGPVMWLQALLEDDGIYVDIVNFNDELFFGLPESRQDKCALVLFKAFLDYYEEHYGQNSDNWLPVYANFANYKLQEKFKRAVERGIFPPESLELSNFTIETEWKNNNVWNIDLRKRTNEVMQLTQSIAKDPKRYFKLSVQNGWMVNVPITDVINAMNDLLDRYPILANDYDDLFESVRGKIDNGNVYFRVPFADFGYLNGIEFEYPTTKDRFLIYDHKNNVLEHIATDPINVKSVFDDILGVPVSGLDFGYPTLNDLIDEAESQGDTQRTASRLKRKRGNVKRPFRTEEAYRLTVS